MSESQRKGITKLCMLILKKVLVTLANLLRKNSVGRYKDLLFYPVFKMNIFVHIIGNL